MLISPIRSLLIPLNKPHFSSQNEIDPDWEKKLKRLINLYEDGETRPIAGSEGQFEQYIMGRWYPMKSGSTGNSTRKGQKKGGGKKKY